MASSFKPITDRQLNIRRTMRYRSQINVTGTGFTRNTVQIIRAIMKRPENATGDFFVDWTGRRASIPISANASLVESIFATELSATVKVIKTVESDFDVIWAVDFAGDSNLAGQDVPQMNITSNTVMQASTPSSASNYTITAGPVVLCKYANLDKPAYPFVQRAALVTASAVM